jgi:predicted dehydrogenase
MKVVIVGLGIQGRKRMAIAGPEVVATVDPVEPAAKFRRVEEVPLGEFEAACVCTPDSEKIHILTYLLSHGKHVLVEKPLLASDSTRLRVLDELARQSRAVCYTAYNHRFEPNLAKLKTVLDTRVLGEVYLVRAFYGNGTARDVRNSSWRDMGLGVLADLGSHLLDLCLFCFGSPASPPEVWSCNRFENVAPDHVQFGFPGRPTFEFEASLVSWRNSFSFEVFGERGSVHVFGLCKWGPSALVTRRRVLPSGKPDEDSHILEQADPTWAAEYGHFVALCGRGGTNTENDVWINDSLNELGRSAGRISERRAAADRFTPPTSFVGR